MSFVTRLVPVLSMCALFLAGAASSADAQTPSVPTRITNVGFLVKPTTLPCRANSPILSIELTGPSLAGGSGRIVVTRTETGSTTPQEVKAVYSLAVNEKKTFTVTVPYVFDCTRAVSTFTVSLVATTGGWNNQPTTFKPKGVTFSETRVPYYGLELVSEGDTRISALKAGSTVAAFGADPKISATVTPKAGTAASGYISAERTIRGSSRGAQGASYNVAAGGTQAVALSWSAEDGGNVLQLAAVPLYSAYLVPSGMGMWDGYLVRLSPSSLTYGTN